VDEPAPKEILEGLLASPIPVLEALRPQSYGGLPDSGGLYAWWAVAGSLASVPRHPHPTFQDVDLFYVGIAPSREGSLATLRSRVIRNHVRGNIGASTFRFTLAALLLDRLELRPTHPSDRPVLSREDNAKLSIWQRENLRITWAEHPQPWLVEFEVIRALQPPLNVAENASHAFYAVVRAARKRLRRIARGEAVIHGDS